jgi:hypothetical protein
MANDDIINRVSGESGSDKTSCSEFTGEERCKTVYIAICWQNEKGERGHCSEIETAIVP